MSRHRRQRVRRVRQRRKRLWALVSASIRDSFVAYLRDEPEWYELTREEIDTLEGGAGIVSMRVNRRTGMTEARLAQPLERISLTITFGDEVTVTPGPG